MGDIFSKSFAFYVNIKDKKAFPEIDWQINTGCGIMDLHKHE